jgi:outer membrane protein OmpU
MIRTSSKSIGGKFKGDTMKKILLGTTAVVALATMSTEAFAADKIKLGLGGFMRHYIGMTNGDETASTSSGVARDKNLSQFSNTEVYFKGDTTLDNGINVAVVMQLEADSAATADNMDETYVKLSSDAMGALSVGATQHAADDFLVRVPNASNFDWGDTNSWAGVAATSTTATTTFSPVSNDITDTGSAGSAKLKYVTPTFSGVTAYASYSAAEGSGTHDARRLTGTLHDGATMGVAYSGEMSGATVDVDLTHMVWGNSDASTTHAGVSVGMAGFTVGGGYSDFNDERSATTAAQQTAQGLVDGNAWELGVGYETGPISVSAAYMSAESTGTVATAGDNEDTKWQASAAYDLGAGVNLSALYFHSKADAEGATAATSVNGVIAGIEVGF